MTGRTEPKRHTADEHDVPGRGLSEAPGHGLGLERLLDAVDLESVSDLRGRIASDRIATLVGDGLPRGS